MQSIGAKTWIAMRWLVAAAQYTDRGPRLQAKWQVKHNTRLQAATRFLVVFSGPMSEPELYAHNVATPL